MRSEYPAFQERARTMHGGHQLVRLDLRSVQTLRAFDVVRDVVVAMLRQ